MSVVERIPERWRARARRAVPYLPWLSLATGIGGALIMNRTPGRAWLVIAAAIVGWVLLIAFNFMERGWEPESASARQKGTRFVVMVTSQSAAQIALFFPLPFYVNAAVVGFGHALFFTLYAGVVVVVLWDPLFRRAMAHGLSSFIVHASAVFLGLNMVLPVLGLSNQLALVVAAGASALGVAVFTLVSSPPARRLRRALVVIPVAALVVLLARLGAPLVPPAPLELVSVAVGTAVVDRELVGRAAVFDRPAELACHSAVKAPAGLKDALVHVWNREGRAVDRVSLDVRGGARAAGFRTWSRLRSPRPGRYACRVETASGQVLGSARFVVR